jgi:anti-sigma factor RsiW
MKCEPILGFLEDYHYGELDDAQARRIEAHLAECDACTAQLKALRSEDRLYREYSDGLESELRVPPEMWQHIRAGIARNLEREPRAWWPSVSRILPDSPWMRQALFAAALVVVSVGATLLAVRYYNDARAEKSLAGTVQEGPAQTSLEAALASIRRAEAEYLDAIRVLSAVVERRKETMDASLVAELEANLRAIDESIAATRRAYLEHPTDPELVHFMLAAYSKKVELLQELSSS